MSKFSDIAIELHNATPDVSEPFHCLPQPHPATTYLLNIQNVLDNIAVRPEDLPVLAYIDLQLKLAVAKLSQEGAR